MTVSNMWCDTSEIDTPSCQAACSRCQPAYSGWMFSGSQGAASGGLEHIHADLLVLIRAAARDAQTPEDGAVAFDRDATLGRHDRAVPHPADLREEHRIGVPPVLQHFGWALHDGGGVRLGQSDVRSHGPGAVHPLDQHDETAVVDNGDAQCLTKVEGTATGVLGEGTGLGEGQGHAVRV
jgi:hypothetical protein